MNARQKFMILEILNSKGGAHYSLPCTNVYEDIDQHAWSNRLSPSLLPHADNFTSLFSSVKA